MEFFNKVKENVNIDIPDELLIAIVFEMSRYFDSQITNEYKRIQKENKVIIDSPTRKQLRKKYYYHNFYNYEPKYNIGKINYTNDDIEIAFKDCYERLNKYDKTKIINSMQQRVDDLNSDTKVDSNMSDWLNYYSKKVINKKYSLASFVLDQEKFQKNNYNENIITDFIKKTYDNLENYRYLAIVIKNEIYNEKNEAITWNLLYKAGIYAENFIQYKGKFNPFKKETQIETLKTFLNERGIDNSDKIAAEFYSSISTGFKFEDCYISDNQDCKMLILKKIELDESPVPCPSCNTTIQRGNSYPEIFLRSYECSNPNCPDRSKSGRGKRFDEFGTYRYFKLVQNKKNNRVSETDYQNWRRDIFNHELNWIDLLINEYAYEGETIYITDQKEETIKGRKLINVDYNNFNSNTNSVESYDELPIVKLFKEVQKSIKLNKGDRVLKNDYEIFNDNSSNFLQTLKPSQVGTAITSPPYYNAREYSQWSNMILYYVDMLINCNSVYQALEKNGYYLYNIGDIVSEDNVYVVSNMSKKKCQLGFLSCMIFELAGFNLTGNIIWDKGEVQSKRNSTVNLFTGYVKCINCYEHVFVFRKGTFEKLSNTVERIIPVIKINNKGENKYKHTAPYPEELVSLIKPFIKEKSYVLDPFLGSGTTLKWCRKNNYKGLGIEMNKNYYELCKTNIFSEAANEE